MLVAGTLSTRVQSLVVRVETKTKDNVFVQLISTIQYRVVRRMQMMHSTSCRIPNSKFSPTSLL
uniref:Uncharacterized protein n=1 Tax=Triticum urartu TaxID=4572 RepID=A0A8R7R9U0_TRIUA